MCKRTLAASAANGGDGDESQTGPDGREVKDTAPGEFTPLILAILAEVGSIDMSAEDTGLLNINLSTFTNLGDQQVEQEVQFHFRGLRHFCLCA